MATADQVKALVQSHADGDDGHFYSVAMQVAARAAKQRPDQVRSGTARIGRRSRKASSTVRQARGVRPIPVVQPPRGPGWAACMSRTPTGG